MAAMGVQLAILGPIFDTLTGHHSMHDEGLIEARREAIAFAQTEFFEYRKERSQLRLLASSILGAAVPISISLISLFETPPFHSAEFIAAAAIALMVLSFVYALFSLIHVNSSRRHDEIVAFLKECVPSLETYFRGSNPPDPSDERSFAKMFFDNIWTLCNGMIFVAPCPTALFFAFLLTGWSERISNGADWAAWISGSWWVFTGINAVLFISVFYQWNYRRSERKLTPWNWLKGKLDIG